MKTLYWKNKRFKKTSRLS